MGIILSFTYFIHDNEENRLKYYYNIIKILPINVLVFYDKENHKNLFK